MNVIIVGSGEMLMNLIAGCEDCGCNIVGVLCAEKKPFFKRTLKNFFNPEKVKVYIKSHNIKEIKNLSVNSNKFKKEIINLNADIVLVGSWGEKFKKDVINLPKMCTINVHPSLLPKYRGPNPYIEVIRNFEASTGVTFHLMSEKYDCGPILKQTIVEILETDTSKELKTRITTAARNSVCELLQQMDTDIIIPLAQNEKYATYYKKFDEKDILIDFKKSTKEISAQIRAFFPFSSTYLGHNSHYLSPNPYKLKILENEKGYNVGTIYDVVPKTRTISVVCGDGKVLQMSDVKLFGILKLVTNLYIRLRIKVGKSII